MRQAWHEVNHLPEAFDWLTRGSKKTRTLFVIMLWVLVLCLFTTTPNKILPNLCKGVARSKGFLILLAYAREILGIIAEDLIYFLTASKRLSYTKFFTPDLSGLIQPRRGFYSLSKYVYPYNPER